MSGRTREKLLRARKYSHLCKIALDVTVRIVKQVAPAFP